MILFPGLRLLAKKSLANCKRWHSCLRFAGWSFGLALYLQTLHSLGMHRLKLLSGIVEQFFLGSPEGIIKSSMNWISVTWKKNHQKAILPGSRLRGLISIS